MQEEKHMRWKEKVWRMKMAAHLHLSMYLSQCELDSPQYVRRLRWDETAKIMTCHNLCSSVRILLPNGRVAKMESLHSTLLLSTFFPFVCHLVFIMQRTYIMVHEFALQNKYFHIEPVIWQLLPLLYIQSVPTLLKCVRLSPLL